MTGGGSAKDKDHAVSLTHDAALGRLHADVTMYIRIQPEVKLTILEISVSVQRWGWRVTDSKGHPFLIFKSSLFFSAA